MLFEVDKNRGTVAVDRGTWATATVGCYVAGWIGNNMYHESHPSLATFVSHPSWLTFLLPIAAVVLALFKLSRRRRIPH